MKKIRAYDDFLGYVSDKMKNKKKNMFCIKRIYKRVFKKFLKSEKFLTIIR